MIDPNYDPGEVWDALNDDDRLKKAAAALKKAAAAYVIAVGDAIEAMEDLARRDRDNAFQQEVDENRYAFVEKLAKTALHVDLEELKAEYLSREEPQGDECGACGKCGSLSPWRCGCNDAVVRA
jgi:hypothetical protein